MEKYKILKSGSYQENNERLESELGKKGLIYFIKYKLFYKSFVEDGIKTLRLSLGNNIQGDGERQILAILYNTMGRMTFQAYLVHANNMNTKKMIKDIELYDELGFIIKNVSDPFRKTYINYVISLSSDIETRSMIEFAFNEFKMVKNKDEFYSLVKIRTEIIHDIFCNEEYKKFTTKVINKEKIIKRILILIKKYDRNDKRRIRSIENDILTRRHGRIVKSPDLRENLFER